MSDDSRIADGRLDFQLAYGDCDVVGIAYFGIYYRWMERCYTTWLYANGIRSGEMGQQLGIVTVGIRSSARYLDTVRVFDQIGCQAVLERLGESSYTVGYEFLRGDNLVTKGQMTFAARDPENFTKTAVPDELRDILGRLPAPRFDVTG